MELTPEVDRERRLRKRETEIEEPKARRGLRRLTEGLAHWLLLVRRIKVLRLSFLAILGLRARSIWKKVPVET